MSNEYAIIASQLERRTLETFSKQGWDCSLAPHYIDLPNGQRFAPDITLAKDNIVYGFVECIYVRPDKAASGKMISQRKRNQIFHILDKVKPELFILTEGRNYEVYYRGKYCSTMTVPLGYQEYGLLKQSFEKKKFKEKALDGKDSITSKPMGEAITKGQDVPSNVIITGEQKICLSYDKTTRKLQSLSYEFSKIKDSYLSPKEISSEKDELILNLEKKLAEKDRIIAEKDRIIAEKDKTIAEKDRAIAEKDKTITEKDVEINELEERIHALYEQLDKQMAELSEDDAEVSTATCELLYGGFWNKLDEFSQKYLTMAQYLFKIFSSGNCPLDYKDFSPSVLELGRAAENELRCKIFSGFIERLSGRTDGMSGNVGRYGDLKKAVRKYLDNDGEYYIPARKMVEYLTFLPEQEEGDTYNNALKRYLREQNINKDPLAEASFTNKADELFDRYRNKAAHPGTTIQLEEAETCSEKTKEMLGRFMSAVQ